MRARDAIGGLIVVAGAVVVPFGHWIAPIFYLVGIGLLLLGCLLVFSGRRGRKHDSEYSDPSDPGFPVVGEAKGFHGAAFHESDGTDTHDTTDE